MFCLVKLLHTAPFYLSLLKHLFGVIEDRLEWVDEPNSQGGRPVWQPDPNDTRHATSLLEATYYKRDLHALDAEPSA
eukprot:3567432-Alexandrium_andersonii.AAC.1